mgnify:CR=1 FL=1
MAELTINTADIAAALKKNLEDFKPAVEAAQAYGVRVHLWGVEPSYGTNQAERLVWESDTVYVLTAEVLKPFFRQAHPMPVPTNLAKPTPAQVFAKTGRDHAASSASKPLRATPVGGVTKLGPAKHVVEEVGEHVAQKWILTRGRDNVRDLLPGPILPAVIDVELLVEAEKELGHSLRPYPEARVWLRDGFWARVYREFDIGVGTSTK